MGTELKLAAARVLLLERNEYARQNGAAWLRLNGLEVCEVATQSDAIREIAMSTFAAAVVDLCPSSPEEWSLLVWVHEKHPEVPVVALLRDAPTADLRARYAELNIRAVLRKPCTLGAICDTVRDVIQRASGRGVAHMPFPLSALARDPRNG